MIFNPEQYVRVKHILSKSNFHSIIIVAFDNRPLNLRCCWVVGIMYGVTSHMCNRYPFSPNSYYKDPAPGRLQEHRNLPKQKSHVEAGKLANTWVTCRLFMHRRLLGNQRHPRTVALLHAEYQVMAKLCW